MTEAGTIQTPRVNVQPDVPPPYSHPTRAMPRIKIGSLGIDTYSESGLI
jgi:hypothetical protein